MPTILIVDDSGFQRAFLRRTLTEGGHTVLEAGNGDEALATVAAERPDAILTDLIMPDMRGLALLETLAEQGSDVPVVVLTADIQQRVQQQCLEAGAARVLHKPVAPELLLGTLGEVLGDEADP